MSVNYTKILNNVIVLKLQLNYVAAYRLRDAAKTNNNTPPRKQHSSCLSTPESHQWGNEQADIIIYKKWENQQCSTYLNLCLYKPITMNDASQTGQDVKNNPSKIAIEFCRLNIFISWENFPTYFQQHKRLKVLTEAMPVTEFQW